MKTLWVLAIGLVLVSVSGCCGGGAKAACEEACAKSEESQKTTCASMEGEAKTTCEAQIKPNIEQCKKACAGQ
jgi:hypothetical protein